MTAWDVPSSSGDYSSTSTSSDCSDELVPIVQPQPKRGRGRPRSSLVRQVLEMGPTPTTAVVVPDALPLLVRPIGDVLSKRVAQTLADVGPVSDVAACARAAGVTRAVASRELERAELLMGPDSIFRTAAAPCALAKIIQMPRRTLYRKTLTLAASCWLASRVLCNGILSRQRLWAERGNRGSWLSSSTSPTTRRLCLFVAISMLRLLELARGRKLDRPKSSNLICRL